MRLYQSGALLTGARNEVIRRGVRHRGRSAPDGPVAHTMGADFVKVMSTGGFMTKGAPPWSAQFSPAELEALVAEAHRLGKRAAAHAHGRLGIAQAVTAQVDTIEHCSFAGPDRK